MTANTMRGQAHSLLLFLSTLLLISLLFPSFVSSACFIAGFVNNSSNGVDANGMNVTGYNASIGFSDHLNATIGEFESNLYLFDCEAAANPCQIDHIWTVEVIDIGDGWFAGPVNVTISGSCAELAPDMQLKDKPVLTIRSPNNNSLLFGNRLVNVTATDAAGGVDDVIYMIGNNSGNFSKTGSIGFSFLTRMGSTDHYNDTFDTLNFGDGNYTLWIIANDTEQSGTTTGWINVLINNTLPDLSINNSEIFASTLSPASGFNVSFNVTVRNRGDAPASNILVVFYNESKNVRSQISNLTISSLAEFSATNVSFNWTAVVGTHNITIELDYAYQGEGNITEDNETNNIGNITVRIPIYIIYAGNLSGNYVLADASDNVLFLWTITQLNSSHIFAADSESSIDFTNLTALGMNDSDGVEFDDFGELDNNLSVSVYDDNITATWTSGGVVRRYENLTLYDRLVHNIPITNSTSLITFRTGILWDSSDGGHEFNTSQDVLFVTPVNMTSVGTYGTYDFELKVPAALKNYKQSAGDSINLYAELK